MHDCKMALVPERLKGSHGGVQTEEAIQIKRRISRDIDRWPHCVIGLLTVRDDNV
jgi:hypothetical protein